MNATSILVVVPDSQEARTIAAGLEDAGYRDVMLCPGPSGPTYRCIGGRGGACPLSDAADVVVVDLHQRSDEVMHGMAGWELAFHYVEHRKRVVAIAGEADLVRPREDEFVRVVDRPVELEPLLQTIERLNEFP